MPAINQWAVTALEVQLPTEAHSLPATRLPGPEWELACPMSAASAPAPRRGGTLIHHRFHRSRRGLVQRFDNFPRVLVVMPQSGNFRRATSVLPQSPQLLLRHRLHHRLRDHDLLTGLCRCFLAARPQPLLPLR